MINFGMILLVLLPWLAGWGDSRLDVLKVNEKIYVRTCFSEEQDLVQVVGKGLNRQVNFSKTLLVSKNTPMKTELLEQGVLIHDTGDDAAPWNFNGTYIGANHGSCSVLDVISKKHGKTSSDLGSEWLDEQGNRFLILKIVNENELWVHSENHGSFPLWSFVTRISGNLKNEQQQQLPVESYTLTQLRPALRIHRSEYKIDGTIAVVENQVVTGKVLEITDEHEIVNPADVLNYVRQHRGQEFDFIHPSISSVLTNRIVYRFDDRGAVEIRHIVKTAQPIQLNYMGFVQSFKLSQGKYDALEYYIPRTLPFRVGETFYDFSRIQDFGKPVTAPIYFKPSEKNVEDSAKPLDRFIQFLGNKKEGVIERKIGFVMGYSWIHGLTRPEERGAHLNQSAFIWTTSKVYPYAMDQAMKNPIPAGSEFEFVGYRQYFLPPTSSKATCCYWHKEGEDWVVYADYHQAVLNDRLKLPSQFEGKKIKLIEKTPTLQLNIDETIPSGGPLVTTESLPSFVIFKIE